MSSQKTLDMALSITRPHGGNGEEYINIEVQDRLSGVRFLQLKVDLAAFASCLTGSSFTDVKGTVLALHNVGKERETEAAKATLSRELFDSIVAGPYDARKERLADYLKAHHQRPGWNVNSYLGSQSSIVERDGIVTLNFSHTRYTEVE